MIKRSMVASQMKGKVVHLTLHTHSQTTTVFASLAPGHVEAAAELTAAAEAECDAARAERKALVRQWQDALTALGGRDEALQVSYGPILAACYP